MKGRKNLLQLDKRMVKHVSEELDLEDDELEGKNIASLVSLDHMRELRGAHF